MRQLVIGLLLCALALTTLTACSSGPMTATQQREADEWIDGPGSD